MSTPRTEDRTRVFSLEALVLAQTRFRLAMGNEMSHAPMRLAIADPPYPPSRSVWPKRRASRWYGKGLATDDRQADEHAECEEWDDPRTHRRLLVRLMSEFDGWAIATSPDGIAAYGDLPAGVRIMAWVKPNAQPGSHRMISCWEPVILFPPVSRRSNRDGTGSARDAFIENAPHIGFRGAKPSGWTHWVLNALGYSPGDEVVDLFPGSGSVARAIDCVPMSLPLTARTPDEVIALGRQIVGQGQSHK